MNKLLIALLASILAGPTMAADEPEAAPAKSESAQKTADEAPNASADEEKGAATPAPAKAGSEAAAE